MKHIALALLLLPFTTMADPGPAIRYLMNEPASMFDIGMMRFKEMLDSLQHEPQENYRRGAGKGGEETGLVFKSPEYILADDLIYVEMYVVRSGGNLEKGCKTAIDELKRWVSFLIMVPFNHHGYSMQNEPESWEDNLKSRIQIGCKVVGDNLEVILYARSKLTEDAVFVTKGAN